MKSKRMEIYIYATLTHTFLKSWVVILISYKVHFRTRTITRNLKEHFIMTKWLIDQENIKILNVNALNNIAQNTCSKNGCAKRRK